MKTLLMNSAMMPVSGLYQMEALTSEEFFLTIKNEENIQCFIGYEQNLQIIEENTGKRFDVCREQIMDLERGDRMLVMKLNYRVSDPTTKGMKVNKEDFSYFWVLYFGIYILTNPQVLRKNYE